MLGDANRWHILSCRSNTTEWCARHGAVVEAIVLAVRANGGRAYLEPNGTMDGSKKRPDIFIVMGEERILVDVTVVHSITAHRIRQLGVERTRAKPRVNDGMRALNVAVAEKHAKYAGIEANGARLMVAAVSTYGAMHIDFLRLLKLIATAGTGGDVPTGLRWSLDRIAGAVSVALTRGNDAVVQGYLQLAATGGSAYLQQLAPKRGWRTLVEHDGMDAQTRRVIAAHRNAGGGAIAGTISHNSLSSTAKGALAGEQKRAHSKRVRLAGAVAASSPIAIPSPPASATVDTSLTVVPKPMAKAKAKARKAKAKVAAGAHPPNQASAIAAWQKATQNAASKRKAASSSPSTADGSGSSQ